MYDYPYFMSRVRVVNVAEWIISSRFTLLKVECEVMHRTVMASAPNSFELPRRSDADPCAADLRE